MKKLSAILLSSTLLLTAVPTTSHAASFQDIEPRYWASAHIDFLTNKKVILGFPDGTFKPESNISRLQAILMLLRERGVTDLSNVKDPGFIDVKPDTYGYKEIAKAVELGLVNGKIENGKKYFHPDGLLNRAEMAKILSLNYGLTGTYTKEFQDVPTTHWAHKYIQAAAKTGIALGYGDGKFGAHDPITRAQFAVMIARTIEPLFRITTDSGKPPIETVPPPELPFPDGY